MRDSIFFWDEDEGDNAQSARYAPCLVYTLLLSGEQRVARLKLPTDLNVGDVERLVNMLRTLPIPKEESR